MILVRNEGSEYNDRSISCLTFNDTYAMLYFDDSIV